MKKQLIMMTGLLLIAAACKKNTLPQPSTSIDCSTITYQSTIKPLFDANCLACHGATSGNGAITNYEQTKLFVHNGKIKSTVITSRSMPEGKTLSSDQLGQIQCWLDAGAPNN